MNEDVNVLSAMEIAAFERREDGTFVPLSAFPAWFTRIVADGVFPFLGHILEDANEFWSEQSSGRRDFGPCAEMNESGKEFHYSVSAITADGKQYLVFQLDPGSDRMREVLQQVREQALAAGDGLREEAVVERTYRKVRQTARDIQSAVSELPSLSGASARIEHWKNVSAKCEDLVGDVEALIKVLSPSSLK